MIDGFYFGFIDNAVLLLGCYCGALSVEHYFEGRGALGAVIGGYLGNTVSDGIGALIDPAFSGLFAGIVLGCLAPGILIPLIERLRTTTGE